MLRIAHIIGKWLGGGVESVVMNYYRNIDKTKYQFDFLCDSDSKNIPYQEIENLGGKVILIPPYQKIFKYQKVLKKILKENNYQIVHSHINTLSIFPLYAAKKSQVPIRIAHSHSTSSKKEIKRNLIKNILKPFSKLYATDYFCCSKLAGIYQFSKKTYENGQVYLLNNAIDINKYSYNKKIRQSKRKELGIKPTNIVIGHIGRFITQKNHIFLVDTFYEILKTNPNYLLVMIGQGPLQKNIQKKIEKLNISQNVLLLGQRNDVHELLQAIDIFLLPSLYEGLPLSLIEAQTASLPCLISNNITKEAKILNTTHYLKLDKDVWASHILKYTNYKRIPNLHNSSIKKYNIIYQVKQLETKYQELLFKENK